MVYDLILELIRCSSSTRRNVWPVFLALSLLFPSELLPHPVHPTNSTTSLLVDSKLFAATFAMMPIAFPAFLIVLCLKSRAIEHIFMK